MPKTPLQVSTRYTALSVLFAANGQLVGALWPPQWRPSSHLHSKVCKCIPNDGRVASAELQRRRVASSRSIKPLAKLFASIRPTVSSFRLQQSASHLLLLAKLRDEVKRNREETSGMWRADSFARLAPEFAFQISRLVAGTRLR